MMNKKRQSVCVIAAHVVVVHAAALTLMVSSSPVQTGQPSTKTAGGSIVHARLSPPPSAAPPAQPNIPSDEAPIPAAPTSTEAPPLPADTLEPTAPVAEEQPLAKAEVESSATTVADAGDHYLPRPLLSTPPRSSTPVIVPFPPEITAPGRYTTILALFIDENGVVRRVRIDGPSLPKPLEDAARDSFLQAHFRPGEVQGQQVKSLIRVEVVFDNTPIESPSQPQSL